MAIILISILLKVMTKNQLGLQLNFRNVLFFNRGKQRYTTSYTYLSNKSLQHLINWIYREYFKKSPV